MSHISEIHYEKPGQRKLLYIDAFITSLMAGIFITQAYHLIRYYFFYQRAAEMLTTITMMGIFLGTLTGLALFSIVKKYRVLLSILEVFIAATLAVFFLRNIIVQGDHDALVMAYQQAVPLFYILLGLIPFSLGLKAPYLLKAAIGDYLDSKSGLPLTIFYISLGFLLGIITGIVVPLPVYVPALLTAALPVIPVFLKLEFNPQPLIAEQSHAPDKKTAAEKGKKDTTLFLYLNAVYIVIYTWLAYKGMIRFYGTHSSLETAFLIFCITTGTAGYLLGSRISISGTYVFLPVLYPLLTTMYIMGLFSFSSQVSHVYFALLFVPLTLLFGFSLYHSLVVIRIRFNHHQRFIIVLFALVLIPTLLIVAMNQIVLTDIWFFVILYGTATVNLLLPAIHATGIQGHMGRKIALFSFSILMLPFFIFNHLYLDVPITWDLFIKTVKGFSLAENTNYNVPYIQESGNITWNNLRIFQLNNSVIKGYKRSALVPAFYMDRKRDRVLIIDGNQRFFRNPLYNIYSSMECIDPLSREDVDYRTLPVSGRQLYISEHHEVTHFLSSLNKQYNVIYVVPNIIEQTQFHYRSTAPWYRLIKQKLLPQGIIYQVFSLRNTSPAFLRHALENTSLVFSHHRTFLFPGMLAIVSSNSSDAFQVTEKRLEETGKLFTRNDVSKLFFNRYHLMSHMSSLSINDILTYLPQLPSIPTNREQQVFGAWKFLEHPWKEAVSSNRMMEKDIEEDRTIMLGFQRYDKPLSLLKIADVAEDNRNFRLETENLSLLMRQAQYDIPLRDYMKNVYTYKKKYYHDQALRFEKNRKWNQARELYHAILTMDPNDFNALYKLGIIYVTLQDLPQAFSSLQKALLIKNEDPQVLYELGVLYFSNGDYNKSLDYLTRSLKQHQQSVPLFLYLGLVHEKLNKLPEAEKYLRKAMLMDPNDPALSSQLQRVREKIEKEKTKWDLPEQKNETDVEKGVEMPIPINKSAYDIRLKDQEKKQQ